MGGKNLQVDLFPRGSDKRGVVFSTSVLGITKGAKDADAAWEVRTSQDEPVVRRGLADEADLRVTATASDLFLLVWNRRAQDGLDVVGDTSLLDLWRQSVFVRWR